MYILVGIAPSVDITGGPWFTDNELDVEFIDQLKSQTEFFLNKRVRYDLSSFSFPSLEYLSCKNPLADRALFVITKLLDVPRWKRQESKQSRIRFFELPQRLRNSKVLIQDHHSCRSTRRACSRFTRSHGSRWNGQENFR